MNAALLICKKSYFLALFLYQLDLQLIVCPMYDCSAAMDHVLLSIMKLT